MDDSGSKALSSLRTVFHIVRLAEGLTFCQFLVSTTATRSWDEGSKNSNSQLRWGFHIYSFIRTNLMTSGRSLLWFTTKRLTFQEFLSKRSLQNIKCRSLQNTVGCKQRPRNWQKTHTGQSLQTPILFSYWLPTVTSESSNSTFICFESLLLFFSFRWMVVSRVFFMLSRSDSLAFGGRWNSTSGIKIWVYGFSVFRLHTSSWTLFASRILPWICRL